MEITKILNKNFSVKISIKFKEKLVKNECDNSFYNVIVVAFTNKND